MGVFKLHSDFEPAGDQPRAIDSLAEGIRGGGRFQTLLTRLHADGARGYSDASHSVPPSQNEV